MERCNNILSGSIKIKRHPLAQRKLKSITADHIQTYVNFLSCGGTGPDGERCEPLEVGTVKSYLNLLNKVFSFAIFPKRLLAVNPVEHVTIRPKPKNSDIFQTEDSSESHVLSPEQYRVLTDYLKKQRNPALLPVQMSYYTGLRLGEACGLTWKDINLDEQFLTVKRSIGYSSARKATTVGPTKNKKPRTVDFGDNLADILRKAKAQQARESLKYGPLYKVNYYQKTADLKRTFNDLYTLNRNEIPPDGYVAVNFVCVRHDGEYQRPSTITSLFQSISKTLPGMGNIHFHQLRHTYASNLVKSGAAPKDVQELLGHANISTTMNIYAHAERDSKRATARLLDKLASGE